MTTMIKVLVTSLASGLTLFALAGCAAPVESTDSPEQTEATQEAIGNCACWGGYVCASNGYDFAYDALGCGPFTKPQAASQCRSQCGGKACVDSGWLCP